MNVFIARIASAIAAAVITWLLSMFGVDVTEQEKAGLIETMTHGVTLLGLALWGVLYAVGHKIISKRTNPADTAQAPKAVATRVGLERP